MKLDYMLSQMCQNVLSNADINAIRKTRGFTKEETASRLQLESVFLSSIGLEAVMSQLTVEETAGLFLLGLQTKEVGVAFFERVYPNDRQKDRYYYRTFTQEYKPVYDSVKKNLVKKGLLVVAESQSSNGNTKLERLRFRFPSEFIPYLPSLLPETQTYTELGINRRETVQRQKILEAIENSSKKKSKRS